MKGRGRERKLELKEEQRNANKGRGMRTVDEKRDELFIPLLFP